MSANICKLVTVKELFKHQHSTEAVTRLPTVNTNSLTGSFTRQSWLEFFFAAVLRLLPIQSNSSMHHYECVVLFKDICLQRGRFCARSLASCIPRSSEDRSSWMVFQVVRGHPGGCLHFSGGGSKMAWLASALFTAHELHCEYSHWNTCVCVLRTSLYWQHLQYFWLKYERAQQSVMWLIGRLKVNIGNIYFKQRMFAKAIKNYRMALDQIPNNTHAGMKYVCFPFHHLVCLHAKS